MNSITSAPDIIEVSSTAGAPLPVGEPHSQVRPKLTRVDRWLSIVILACGLLTVAIGAAQLITSQSTVPLWDEWQEIDPIVTARQHQPPISWLWSLHNEHRVVFYRLLLLADIHFFDGKHRVYFWSMLAVQILFLATLALMLRFAGVKGAMWRAAVGLGAFAVFCPSQWENFGWAFQISFLLPGLFLILALFALLKYERSVGELRPKWIYLALSILAAGAATYSNANGVVLWPLLLLVAIAVLPRREVLASYAGFGLLFIGSYLYHYSAPSIHSSPLNSIRHPLPVLEYMAGYLGVIFPPWVHMRDFLAVSSGMAGLLIGLVVTIWVLRRQPREPLHVALLAVMYFAVATAFITALGRIGFGLAQAFSSRYQTFNLLFWFSTVVLLLFLIDNASSSLRTLVLGVISVTMLLAFAVFPLGLSASRTRTQQAEAAATSLLAGVPDQEAMGVLFNDLPMVWRDAEYFRQQRLFIFSDEANVQMGQSISSVYPDKSALQCEGQATGIERLPAEKLLAGTNGSALRISGWAVYQPSRTAVRRLLLVADGKIVGYAATLPGPFTAKHSEIIRKSELGSWIGFAQTPRESKTLDIYAVDSGANAVCHLSTTNLPSQ
jgi:hypothetical protein